MANLHDAPVRVAQARAAANVMILCQALVLTASLHGAKLNAADTVPQPAGTVLAAGEILQGLECGNSLLDPGEECDDGNAVGGDGCSATCQVEPGYSCTDPIAPDHTNLVADPGFEAGPNGGIWDESSTHFGTPICDASCDVPAQRSGDHWAWFGGVAGEAEVAMVSQLLTIPATATELRFWLHMPFCDSGDDYFEALIDETVIFRVEGDSPLCGAPGYTEQVIDISAFADDAEHELIFHTFTVSTNGEATDFHLDDIFLMKGPSEPIPSVCSTLPDTFFADGFEIPA